MRETTAFIISHEPDNSRTEKDQAINIIALTLTRALGRVGIKVVRVHPNNLDDSLSSRYCQATEICPDLYQSETSLTRFLTDLRMRYPGKRILIPASDDCSLYMARNEDDLGREFVLVNPSASTMESLKDKRRQYELATKVGVPVPETYFPKSVEELDDIAAALNGYPYVIKPLEAQKWRLRQYANVSSGRKAITVHDREELLNEYRRIAADDSNLMVQEIIGGNDDQLFTFLAYCSVRNKPLAYCIRSKLRQAPVDFGYCTATVSCHNAVIERYSKRLMEQSGYTGIVGIEFKFDPDVNDYKLIEINTRPVNTTGLSIGCGVNLPVIAFLDAAGREQDPVTDWEDGVIWIRLSQDIVTAWELRRQGRLSITDWLRSIRGKRIHAVLAIDDLWPFAKFYWRFCRRQFSRLAEISRVPSLTRFTRRCLQRVSAWIL
jgi:predicted ATP-grasp superfamily ATP-dependent carboligase